MPNLDIRDASPATRAELQSSLEGQLIAGKYRVERLIGVGGMGVVVSALHVDLERYVAIKLIRDELTRDRSTLQRFLLEARAAARMTNEHVCRVLDVDKLDDGTPFIVMELLQGSDLAAILEQRGRVDLVEGVDWVLQACEGVAEAHSLHIVHRDLKPDNLFMTRLGDGSACIKVLDFGISKAGGGNLSGSLTAPRTILGSPRYMAPEQMLFSAADERSDVWAMGTILYELTSGTPAFEGDSVAIICSKVINEPPVPPRAHAPEIPQELQRVILRCLEREPHARYPSVAALAHDLAPLGSASALDSSRKIAATLGAASRMPPAIEPSTQVAATRAARRPRRWLWVAAALGIAGMLMGAQLLWRSKPAVSQDSKLAVPESAAARPSGPEVAAVVSAAGQENPQAARTAAAGVAQLPSTPAQIAGTVSDTARAAALPPGKSPPGAAAGGTLASGTSASGAAPASPGAAQADKALARPSPPRPSSDAVAQPNLQEAWDVRKFGGRE
jgi:serine/threonine-protein kinase